MISVLFGINYNTAMLLQQNVTLDSDGNRTRSDISREDINDLKSLLRGNWKDVTIDGESYWIVAWYLPERYTNDDPTQGLYWMNFLSEVSPTPVYTIGAWNRDGTMLGTAIGTDPETLEDVITGTPVYTLHSKYMEIFPDVGGVQAVVESEVASVAGYKKRRWQ